MKILLSWLKEYIDIDESPAQIGKLLTMAGLEVDAIQDMSLGCQQVVVCKILSVQKHPQADKLNLATVTDGQQTFEVVCGAANCRAGIKTALAMVGATVFDDQGQPFKIKKSKIRGVESCGMLCAPVEIGMPGDEGIIEFSAHVNEGADVASMYADTRFEISLTPNLGHCSSVLGVARELSAITGIPLKQPHIEFKEDPSIPIELSIKVEVLDPLGCPRYGCRLIRNVKVGPSPEWLKTRLEACGMRSINNVVDVTNYVMLELGHPMHAFDYDRIANKQIIVRKAKDNETIVTLDDKERVLVKGDLLICDGEKPIALAGIMGSSSSEVQDWKAIDSVLVEERDSLDGSIADPVVILNSNILLEAACFDPLMIRRTSKRLGLMTDASKHFERGCDPCVLEVALERAVTLIHEIAGGDICKGAIDVAAHQFLKSELKVRLSRINKILGTHLGVGEVEEILQLLLMSPVWDGIDQFTVSVPTYRNDVKIEVDLIEEVARIYGYDNIANGSDSFQISTIPNTPIFSFERALRSRLLSEGLQEFLTCDLIGPTLLEAIQETEMPEKAWVKVLNPTSIEQSILRTTLLPGLLNVVKYNNDHQNHDIAGFEIGRIHFKVNEQYCEQVMASVVLSGNSRPANWGEKSKQWDFFDLKGIIENTLQELNVGGIQFKASRLNSLHPGRQAEICYGSVVIGVIGEVHPSVLRRLDLSQQVFFAEINLNDLIKIRSVDRSMQMIPVYPSSERDWTLTVEEGVSLESILDAISSLKSRLIEKVTLLDIYRSEQLGSGLKNVTLRFVYRDIEKTISQETVEKEHGRIIDGVVKSIKIIN